MIAAMGLEYEEGETVDRPWIVESVDGSLIVATERRVWRLDATPSIRWCWNVKTGTDDGFICAAPRGNASGVIVPVRSRRGDTITHLRMSDGGIDRN
jgi:hypothetical protein